WAWQVYDCLMRGETPPSYDDDTVNAQILTAYRHYPLETLRQMESRAYQDLLALVENASEEALFDPHYFPWLAGLTLAEEIIGGSVQGHYPEHLPDIEDWLGGIVAT